MAILLRSVSTFALITYQSPIPMEIKDIKIGTTFFQQIIKKVLLACASGFGISPTAVSNESIAPATITIASGSASSHCMKECFEMVCVFCSTPFPEQWIGWFIFALPVADTSFAMCDEC